MLKNNIKETMYVYIMHSFLGTQTIYKSDAVKQTNKKVRK